MSSRDGNRRRVLSYEERVLWSAVTQSIAPLHGDAPPPAELDADPRPANPIAPKTRVTPAPPPAPASPGPPPLARLDRRAKKRVVRGHHPIEARFDLHGYTQDQAHAGLLRFLRDASSRDLRLVLVITGKSGVLKRQVPQWLALPEFRKLVVGFEDAHIAHGGEGALYVRVRRSRD